MLSNIQYGFRPNMSTSFDLLELTEEITSALDKKKYYCCFYRLKKACDTIDHTLLLEKLKPATGRPYVRAFSLSGTVPAFTCDCLRFVCAFTPRPKVDLCVSTSSRTMLAFGNNVSCSSSECSTLAFCRR